MNTPTIAAIATVASLIATVVLQMYGIPATISCTVSQAAQAAQTAAAAMSR